MDSSFSPTLGDKGVTDKNVHHACKCLHPLFVFNNFTASERCDLTKGKLHSADKYKEVLIVRYKTLTLMQSSRADITFAYQRFYETLKTASYFFARHSIVSGAFKTNLSIRKDDGTRPAP